MTRVLVCGGTHFADRGAVDQVLGAIVSLTEIIHGAAPGADSLAALWAFEHGVPARPFPADWIKFGRAAAGAERNARMLREGRPDVVVAFVGGSGTADMVERARCAGVPVREIVTCARCGRAYDDRAARAACCRGKTPFQDREKEGKL